MSCNNIQYIASLKILEYLKLLKIFIHQFAKFWSHARLVDSVSKILLI
jgi:hypothetical protein